MEAKRALENHHGEELAEATNGIVRLFHEWYGRGPTKAKSYLLEDRYLVCILGETMTTVERTLVSNGEQALVREVRLRFQETMSRSFHEVVEEATRRRVISYNSQLLTDVDVGIEFFILEDR